MSRQVIKDLADRVIHLVRLVEDLSLRSVEARLARLLLEQAEAGGSVQRRRWATQAEMAPALATVPDVVNRALRKLSDAGLIHVERHQIQILDQEGLKQDRADRRVENDKSRWMNFARGVWLTAPRVIFLSLEISLATLQGNTHSDH